MHYKIIKQVQYEYSYIYIEKLSRIKNIKMDTNVKYLLLANYHDQLKKIPQWNKRHF